MSRGEARAGSTGSLGPALVLVVELRAGWNGTRARGFGLTAGGPRIADSMGTSTTSGSARACDSVVGLELGRGSGNTAAAARSAFGNSGSSGASSASLRAGGVSGRSFEAATNTELSVGTTTGIPGAPASFETGSGGTAEEGRPSGSQCEVTARRFAARIDEQAPAS